MINNTVNDSFIHTLLQHHTHHQSTHFPWPMFLGPLPATTFHLQLGKLSSVGQLSSSVVLGHLFIFHVWERSFSICPSSLYWLHLTWCPYFCTCSSKLLDLCSYNLVIFHLMLYVPPYLHPLICSWIFRLFPDLNCCDESKMNTFWKKCFWVGNKKYILINLFSLGSTTSGTQGLLLALKVAGGPFGSRD